MSLLSRAQDAFNKFIRERDKDKGCISCGGQVQQAGHYYAAGHYTALRFNEVNTNGQCIRCNCFLGSNAINYRKGLIQRYGEQIVKELENSADLRKVKKWSKFELEYIIKYYKIAK